jgi:hypothetical protein
MTEERKDEVSIWQQYIAGDFSPCGAGTKHSSHMSDSSFLLSKLYAGHYREVNKRYTLKDRKLGHLCLPQLRRDGGASARRAEERRHFQVRSQSSPAGESKANCGILV